jgi:hypothetical protein
LSDQNPAALLTTVETQAHSDDSEEVDVDPKHLDTFAKALATGKTRRRVFASAAGAVLAAVGLRRGATDAQAIPGPPWTWPGGVCGGVAGISCPPGFECEIDWNDPECSTDCMGVCRPVSGGGQPTDPCAAILCIEGTTCCSNCGGICVPAGVECSDDLCAGETCGPTVCAAGQTCCNESCGYCTDPGGACTEEFCISEYCGPNACGLGEYCCNESCGTCAPIGGSCTQEICDDGSGVQCGPNVCGEGEYCCNESCGHCAPIGGFCTMEFCGDPPVGGEVCGPTICGPGEVCCNESCGICTPPDGFCVQMACVS